MNLVHHLSEVDSLKLGTSQVDAVYLGNDLVWSALPEVAISNQTIQDYSDVPVDAVATYTLNSDGTNGFLGEWLVKGQANDCEVRATQVSDVSTGIGTSISGTLNTWLNLGTSRSWSATATNDFGNTSRVWTLDLEIRRVVDGVVLDTARIILDAAATIP